MGDPLSIKFVFEDWQGLVDGIIEHDGEAWLARLVARDRTIRYRVYSLAAIPEKVLEVFLFNQARDYCDLSRKQAERDALVGGTLPVSHIMLVDTSEPQVLGVIPHDQTPLNYLPWQSLDFSSFADWQNKFPKTQENIT